MTEALLRPPPGAVQAGLAHPRPAAARYVVKRRGEPADHPVAGGRIVLASVGEGGGGDEARTVFYDADALLYDDPDHCGDEDRYVLVGPSARRRLLLVVHCCQESDEVIRIISAREATRRERDAFVTARSR